jgi:ubiquinone/menaquinone biosynthesis C-methylase UbiE
LPDLSERQPPIIDYEGSDYQTTFWDEGGREYEDQVEAVALRRLLPPQGDLLLEIGAGAGRNTPRYQGYKQVVLLDYSITQLQQAQHRLGREDRFIYVAADAYKLPFVDGLFDTATMIRTIHHLANAPMAIKQVHRVLQPGGEFILEYANKHNLKAILRYLLGRQEWNPFAPEPVEFAPLNFDFHPRTVRNWLQDEGFQFKRQLTVSHFRINALKRIIPLKLLVSIDSLIQWTGNLWQLTPSVFLGCQADQSNPVAEPDAFFRCPQCGYAPLLGDAEALECSSCSERWAISDGIYDFRR